MADEAASKPRRKRSEYLVLQNPDKRDVEKWDERRSYANPPRPWRLCAISPPSGGKSNLIVNLIAHARPPFSRIIVCTCDDRPENEWTTLCEGCEIVPEVPDFREIEAVPGEHTLLVLEDLAYGNMTRDEHERLDRLFGHASSHRNLSIAATGQDFMKLPVCVRRTSNMFALWPCPDVSSVECIATRVGLKRGELSDLFRTVCHSKYHFIFLDLSESCPQPIRLNLTKPITIEE